MSRNGLTRIEAVAFAAALWGASAWADATPPAAAPAPVVAARVTVARVSRNLDLVGRDGAKLLYREAGGPAGAYISMPAEQVESVDFRMTFDDAAYQKAVLARNWAGAAAALMPSVMPLIPYLDLKDNNASEMASACGVAMLKAADSAGRAKSAEPEKIKSAYMDACRVFRALAKGGGYAGADAAQARAAICLVQAGDARGAARELEAVREPEVGDAVYGLYWLAQARIRLAGGDARGAMTAAVKSLTFENKDVDVFPEALLLSARCYEELLEWHRARDVYYETAKLFSGTEWGDAAKQRLGFIMEKGMTQAREASAIESVFFGLNEDMEGHARALLDGTDMRGPRADGPGGSGRAPPAAAAEEVDRNPPPEPAAAQKGTAK